RRDRHRTARRGLERWPQRRWRRRPDRVAKGQSDAAGESRGGGRTTRPGALRRVRPGLHEKRSVLSRQQGRPGDRAIRDLAGRQRKIELRESRILLSPSVKLSFHVEAGPESDRAVCLPEDGTVHLFRHTDRRVDLARETGAGLWWKHR